MPSTRLSPRQQALLDEWLPGHEVAADLSWGLVETHVLDIRHTSGRFIFKAGGPNDHHIERELNAHRRWVPALAATGDAPRFVAGDVQAKALLTEYLPGELVLGHVAHRDPDTFRQAGALLRRLHDQDSVVDENFEEEMRASCLERLTRPHRIDAATEERLREALAGWTTRPVTLVPAHGDWQPRNWLIDDGRVRAIDFGRAALRPALTDFLRIDVQDFAHDAWLERAFIEGYGRDPRVDDPDVYRHNQLAEAIGTAVWAYGVGDEAFEQQGHRMIRSALAAEL